jgi:hypothetical protein
MNADKHRFSRQRPNDKKFIGTRMNTDEHGYKYIWGNHSPATRRFSERN